MINLIPAAASKRIVKEYWIRVCTTWLFLVASVLAALIVLQLPTYILISAQATALDQQFTNAQQRSDRFKAAEDIVVETNALVAHMKDGGNETKYTDVIANLDNLSGTTVKLSQVSFERSGPELMIDIIGDAASRSALASFRDRVEADEQYSDVKLPISNLAKERDITFSMTVTSK